MGIFNRRYALLGWLAWTIGKRLAKQKAKAAVPTVDRGTKRPNRSLLALAVAVAGVATAVLLRRRGGGSDDELPTP